MLDTRASICFLNHPPLAAYNLKISDQAILGRTSTWTYTTIHTTTTYGSTDTRRCGFYFSLEMLQNSQDPIRFINWSSSRCVQSNDFRAPSGAACHRPTGHTYVRQRGFLPTISTSHYGTHSIAPLNPPLSLPLLTVYMEMRLSLQKLLFANIPFAVCSHDEAKRGDDDMTQISESSQLFPLFTFHYIKLFQKVGPWCQAPTFLGKTRDISNR